MSTYACRTCGATDGFMRHFRSSVVAQVAIYDEGDGYLMSEQIDSVELEGLDEEDEYFDCPQCGMVATFLEGLVEKVA